LLCDIGLNFMWIGVQCCPCGAKKTPKYHYFDQPPLPMKVKIGLLVQTLGLCLHAKFGIGFILSPSDSKNAKFCHFGLRHFVVSPVGGDLIKLNMVAQLQTFPIHGSKLFLYSNTVMAKSCAQTRTFQSITDKQMDRQTDKNLNVFVRPGGG